MGGRRARERPNMSMADYATWKVSARKSAEAAIDIYTDREADVERELALHLARALRELDKRDGSALVTVE